MSYFKKIMFSKNIANSKHAGFALIRGHHLEIANEFLNGIWNIFHAYKQEFFTVHNENYGKNSFLHQKKNSKYSVSV
jgi:hypothetical protein